MNLLKVRLLNASIIMSIIWFATVQISAQPATQQSAPIVISDTEFAQDDWSTTLEIYGNPTTLTYQVEFADNPNSPFRHTIDTLPPVPNNEFHFVTAYHIFEESYDPATQGAITAVDYQEDNFLFAVLPPYHLASADGNFILMQDGVIYRAHILIKVDNPNWQTYRREGLQAINFSPFVGGTEGQHPDFSEQGSPIQFGYARTTGRYSGSAPGVSDSEELVFKHSIDNWQVNVWNSDDIPNRAPVAQYDTYVLEGFYYPILGAFSILDNDYDPDGDPLTVTITSQPNYGTVFWNSTQSYVGYIRELQNHYPDNFSYRISDGEYTSSANVDILIDCNCTINCITQSPLKNASSDVIDLELIRRLRDRVMDKTTDGSRYVDMYYRSTPEIARILMITNTELGNEAVDVVELWQSNLYSLVDGDGSAFITQVQVNAIKTFLNNLSDVGSADLQQIIDDELTRLGNLDAYVGLTMREAKQRAIGDQTTFVPLVVK